MGLETGTYLNDLVVTNPVASDVRSEGDDHLRLIKTLLKATFPNMGGAFHRVQVKSAGYTVLASDENTALVCTAALTLDLTAAATLGNHHSFFVFATSGAVVIDPAASETVNGAATLTIASGMAAQVFCNGTGFYAAVMAYGNTWIGPVTGNITGNVTGNVTGNLTGDSAGVHTGAVTGDVTGNVSGSSGSCTGNAATATTSAAVTNGGALNAPASGDLSNCTSNTEAVGTNNTQLATTEFCEAGFVNNDVGSGAIGVFGYFLSTGTVASGATAAGSALRNILFYPDFGGSAVEVNTSGAAATGTWRNVGNVAATTGAASTFQRIS